MAHGWQAGALRNILDGLAPALPNKRMQLTKRVATPGGRYPGAPFFIKSRFAADARCSTGTINMNKGEENRRRRHQLRDQNRAAYDGLSGILFTEDPVGINFGENTDEYEPEVGTILPRLMSCTSVGEVRDVVSQEFTRWFSGSVAGPTDGYERIAQRIWDEILPILRA